MGTYDQLVDQREKGENIPLSIGTARAIESLCGIGDFEAPEPPLQQFDEIWVNLRTLFRNLFNALSKEGRVVTAVDSLVAGLQEDWMILQGAIRQASHGRVTARLYYCSMEGFEKEFPNARYKELSTERQREEQKIEDATVKGYLETMDEEEPIELFNVKIQGTFPKVGMVTHYPVDLLWHRSFMKLVLVESHTGTLKSRADWHTKLTGGKKLSHIPFNRLSIQVFGDGNVLFASMVGSVKKEISDMATSNNWHSLTTTEKIRHNLAAIYDPRVKQFFRSLL